jgi:hypothetical protein
MELFNSRNIIRVHCGIFTHIWSQLSGTNAMMYYIVYIFQVKSTRLSVQKKTDKI